METIRVDIKFLSHLRGCMELLKSGDLDLLTYPEQARERAIIDMTMDQLSEMVHEGELQEF